MAQLPDNSKWRELIGKRFGRLLVADVLYRNNNKWIMHCICACGKSTRVSRNSLINTYQPTLSCGCLQKEKASAFLSSIKTRHGQARRNGGWSPEYRAWYNMKIRCLYRMSKSYKDYGQRGIKVCDKWLHSFESFFADMGPKPGPEYSIDRINNNGNYEPENCRWATVKEQRNNKRNNRFLSLDNQKLTINQWAEKNNIKRTTLSERLKRGWTIEETLTVLTKGEKKCR